MNYCVNNLGGGVAGHRAGITEGEVNVFVSVDIPNSISDCTIKINREPARFFIHPRHRNFAKKVISILKCCFGFWVAF